MARDDEDGESFDPRSWSARAADLDARTGQPSFDPRSWGAPAAEVERPTTVRAPALPQRPRDRMPALAATGSVLILLGGGVAAWLSRTPPDAPVAAVGTPAATVPTAEPVNASRRTLNLSSPDEIAGTLASAGVPQAIATAAAREAAAGLGTVPGDVRLVFDLVGADAARRLTRLEATRDDGAGVVLTPKGDGSFARETLQAKLTAQVRVVRGEMGDTSFYNAAVSAGVTDSLVTDFANAFSYDFNFATDVHPGDIFEAAFEQKVNPSGEAVGPPTLLYVSLSTATKSKSLYRFLAPGEAEPGWFDGNGRSTVTALMRTPVDGARISSPFGMRWHPILHFNKLHKGTDFAAPIGTPIYAAGSATVVWAAMKGPNGNLTILQHDNGWQTYYLHQSMFMPGVVAGARVTQGQKIGEIGTTGRSTGPHLHFELHVDGEPVDPMSVETGSGKVLAADALAQFRKERDRIDRSRAGSAG